MAKKVEILVNWMDSCNFRPEEAITISLSTEEMGGK
jgi:hypothetical protein